ncbi:hypothetical protein CBL_20537 [Carabus blaptoides fortunei]
MQLVCTHELGGKVAFLFQAARRAEVLLGFEDSLIIDESYVGVIQTPAKLQQMTALIKKVEHDMPMEGYMSKHLHSVWSAGLKAETEGFVFVCQDGVMNTLVYQNLITKTAQSTLCRKCHSQPETLMNVLSASPSLASSAFIYRQNTALRVVYYHLRHAYGIDAIPVLPYIPDDVESVVDNSKCRIYWNYPFYTAKLLSAIKSDITLLDLENEQMFVIELSCPAEPNISRKFNFNLLLFIVLLT